MDEMGGGREEEEEEEELRWVAMEERERKIIMDRGYRI